MSGSGPATATDGGLGARLNVTGLTGLLAALAAVLLAGGLTTVRRIAV